MKSRNNELPEAERSGFYLRTGAHLFALSGFAIAQPILSVLSTNIELFVARKTAAIELILLTAALLFVPPLVMLALVWIAGRFGAKWAWWLRIVFIWILLTLFALQLIGKLGEPPWVVSVLGAAAVASAGVALYVRYRTIREYSTFLAVAPLIFAGLFLVGGPVSQFVVPSSPVGAVEVETSTDTSVIFLVLDEFPIATMLNESGQIDAERYPNFAELAGESYWFNYAAASHVYTTKSVAGLLSSNYAEDGGHATSADYPNNLLTLMGATHVMNVYEPETDFCPETVCVDTGNRWTMFELKGLLLTSLEIEKRVLLPQVFEDIALSYDDPFGVFGGTQAAEESSGGFADQVSSQIQADQVAIWREWLASLDGGSQQFDYRHVFMPHAPYQYLPEGTRYNRAEQLIPALDDDGYWTGDEWHTVDAHQRHLLQVQAVDMLIGELVDRLVELGSYDDTMIVVTSDHGVSHVPNSARRDFTPTTAPHVGFVPLIMKAPNQSEGVVWTTPISALDVVPTMAEMIGITVPWDTEGRSVLANPRTEVHILAQTGELELLDPASLDDAVAFVRHRFPVTPGINDIFAYDSFKDLLGLRAIDLDTESTDIVGIVDDPHLYNDIDPESGFLPAFVGGLVTGVTDDLDGASVGVIVNGVVAAVVPAYEIESRSGRFGAVIPPSYFVNGDNELALVLLTSNGGTQRVRAIQIDSDSKYTIETNSGTYLIKDDDGNALTIDESILGFVDTASRPGDRVMFSGWAIDQASMEPAAQVIAFADGLLIAVVNPSGDRQALAEEMGEPGIRYSGFAFELAEASLAPGAELRVFGVSDGRVAELQFVPGALDALEGGS